MKPKPVALVVCVAAMAGGTFSALSCVGDDPGGGASSGDTSSSGGSSGASSSGASSGGSSGGSSSGGSSGAPSDGGADATAAWTPKDLPGLALWLDSTVGTTFDNSKLTGWDDQSGNANNASIGGSCNAPTRAANSLNGKDTLAFAATSDGGASCISVADASSLQFGGDFAVFVVARYRNRPLFNDAGGLNDAGGMAATGTFFAKLQPGSAFSFTGFLLLGSTNNESKLVARQREVSGNSAESTTVGLNDDVFRRLGATRRGTTLEVWINGVADGSTVLPQADDLSAPGQPVLIGWSSVFTLAGLSGNVAEVVAVKGTTSNASIAQLDAYFKAKHAL